MSISVALTNGTIVDQSASVFGAEADFSTAFRAATLNGTVSMTAVQSCICSFLNHEAVVSLGVITTGSAVPTISRDPAVSVDTFARTFMPLNFPLVRGDYYQAEFQILNRYSGAPEAITGTDLIMTAKWAYTDPDASAVFQLTTAGGGIIITDGANGKAVFTILPAHTASLPAVSDPPLTLLYDIVWKETSTTPQTVIRGKIFVLPDVTIT